MPVIVLLFCYLLAFAGPLSYAIVPLLLWALNRSLLRKQWIMSAVLLLANPLALYGLRAIKDYADGAPRMRYMGLMSSEFYNIDRETRCFNSTGGCVVDGHEWVFEAPHNLVLHLLCATLGPPSKSYDGPYPDKETALSAVSTAPLQKVDDLKQGRFSVGDEVFQLSPENASALGLSMGIYMPFGEDFDPDVVRVQGASFEKRCLILRVVELALSDSREFPHTESLVLIDKKNLRPFCYYRISGDRMPRCPSFQYLPRVSH